MRVASLSTVFPNCRQPIHGTFVLERLRHTAIDHHVSVVAPVPWVRQLREREPYRESSSSLAIIHPTFFYSPWLGKGFDAWCLFASALRSFRGLDREHGFDLIDAHFGYPEGAAGVLLGGRFKRPVVVTLRGNEPDLCRDFFRLRAIRKALTRATRIIAVSQPLAEFAMALGAAPDRVDTIPNGVDIERFTPMERHVARSRLNRRYEGPLIVSVGHLSARKGFQFLLDALPLLLPAYPSLSLVIVGGPSAERSNVDALNRKVRLLGLEKHVEFVGPQPPDQVSLWLAAANVFALASQQEGCPNVVWEAIACGTPVVATRVGEIERMVPSHVGVLYGPPDDVESLTRALIKGLNRQWDVNAIRRHAEGRTWKRVADQVGRVWQRAIHEHEAMNPARGRSDCER
jgi:glycosyltransferase involved in cell wall biosynthesis